MLLWVPQEFRPKPEKKSSAQKWVPEVDTFEMLQSLVIILKHCHLHGELFKHENGKTLFLCKQAQRATKAIYETSCILVLLLLKSSLWYLLYGGPSDLDYLLDRLSTCLNCISMYSTLAIPLWMLNCDVACSKTKLTIFSCFQCLC